MSREASEVGTAVRAVPAAAAAAASAATGGRAARARRAKARADDSIVTPGQIRRKWTGGRVGGSLATRHYSRKTSWAEIRSYIGTGKIITLRTFFT